MVFNIDQHTTYLQRVEDQTNQHHIQVQKNKEQWEKYLMNNFINLAKGNTPILLWNNLFFAKELATEALLNLREYCDTNYVARLLSELRNTDINNDSINGINTAEISFEISQFLQRLEFGKIYTFGQYTIERNSASPEIENPKYKGFGITDSKTNKYRNLQISEWFPTAWSDLQASDSQIGSIIPDNNINNGVLWFSVSILQERVDIDEELKINYSSIKIWGNIDQIIDIDSFRKMHDVYPKNHTWIMFNDVQIKWAYDLTDSYIDIEQDTTFWHPLNNLRLSKEGDIITNIEFNFFDINRINFINAMKIIGCSEKGIKEVDEILSNENTETFRITVTKESSGRFMIEINMEDEKSIMLIIN